jgi:hypothetical protein
MHTARKGDDSKVSSYEEFEQVFGRFSKYHMKTVLKDFKAKVGREYIYKTDNWI